MIAIDLVVPMVFPADPQWRQEYDRYHSGDATRNVRYRSWGTEELLVKCCMKYMPWLRRIHILLARESQVQSWMNKYIQTSAPGFRTLINNIKSSIRGTQPPTVCIHFHKDFIPTEHLPCFASPCIEMFLHRIHDLSEHFIYANDDMFPLSPLSPDDFFLPSPTDPQLYLPCQHFTEEPYSAKPDVFHRKCMNQLNMIAVPFGRKYEDTWLRNGHSFAPILKSTCEKVWQRHGAEILHHLSPKSRNDRSYNHYIYSLYQHFAGLSVEHTPRLQYVGSKVNCERLANAIRDPQAGIVCMNDNETIDDWEKKAAVVRREIMLKLNAKV